MQIHRVLAGAAALVAVVVSQGATAQVPYPSKPIRVIFPYAAGGAGDIFVRAYGQKFAEKFGQSWILDNRGGAGSTLGTDLAAKAAPDGYTLLQATLTFAVNAAVYSKLPYDVERDFAPITTLVNVVSILAITPSVPASDVQDLIAYAKTRPGQLSFASTGSGSLTHLAGELFKRMAGIDMLHVPYKGTSQALPDLISGRVHLIFEPMPSMLPHVRAGRMKALGVTTAKRSNILPEIATIAEQGVKGFEIATWYGLFAPAGTPKPVLETLHAAIVEFAASPDIRERLLDLGAETATLAPAQFAAMIKRDVARWKVVARDANIRID